MRKTILLPSWRASPSEDLDEPKSAYASVTHKDGYRHVRFSGGTARGDGVAAQVRAVLERRRKALADLGGGMDDVVASRYYLLADRCTREVQARIHEVRDEFFERPHYPASTMVGIAALLGDALVEVELEAEIPDDRWEAEVLTGAEDGD